MIYPVKKDDEILLVINSIVDEYVQPIVDEINKITNDSNSLEIVELSRYQERFHKMSSIDAILFTSNENIKSEFHEIVKPGGLIVLYKSIDKEEKNEIKSIFANEILQLGINGFVVKDVELINSSLDYAIKGILGCENNMDICRIVVEKPSYEVGSAVTLSFSKSNIWKVDNIIDDDLINDDNFLDDEDNIETTPPTLPVCGVVGKPNACKNCTCGLSESLSDNADVQNAKSSCGNCYLGDAFRCGSCPYLGRPAFKPGEKVLLSDTKLITE